MTKMTDKSEIALSADEREKSLCTMSCCEPSCLEYIHYRKDDAEVPLYCWKHRSKNGRHAAVRSLVQKKEPEPPVLKVVMLCPNHQCRNKTIAIKTEWISGKEYLCEKCGRKMLYHSDVKKELWFLWVG